VVLSIRIQIDSLHIRPVQIGQCMVLSKVRSIVSQTCSAQGVYTSIWAVHDADTADRAVTCQIARDVPAVRTSGHYFIH